MSEPFIYALERGRQRQTVDMRIFYPSWNRGTIRYHYRKMRSTGLSAFSARCTVVDLLSVGRNAYYNDHYGGRRET